MESNTIVVPIIVGLVEVAKRVGLPTKFLPLLAVVLGIANSYLFNEFSIIDGLVSGLMAVGLFSGVKASVGK